MRQFANVSISPWANPYSGAATNTGKNFYATAATPQKQPVYRRIVAPPLPVVYNTGVEQVIDDENDDDQADAGDTSVATETPEALPASEAAPVEAAPTPTEPETFPPVPEPPPATEAIVEVPSTAGADAIVEVVATSEDVKDEPPGPSNDGDTGGNAESIPPPPPPQPQPPAAPVEEVPIEPEPSPAVYEEQPEPVSEPAPPLAPPADPVPAPQPVIVVESEKSGESEHAAQEPPKSPTDKSVHFASDTKDPDAASIGKKKVQLAFGKGKANAFVRPKKPKPAPPVTPPPPPPKEEKKKVIAPVGIMKKRERRSSILSVSSTEKPMIKEESPQSIKTLLGKADERKKKKKDDKKSKGKTEKKDGSPPPSDDKAIQEEDGSKSDISDSVIIEEAEQEASASIISEDLPPPHLNDTLTESIKAEISDDIVGAEDAASTDDAYLEEAVIVSSESLQAETSSDVQEPSPQEAPSPDESVADTQADATDSATEVSEMVTTDFTTTTEEVAPPPMEPDAEPGTESEPPAPKPATKAPEPSRAAVTPSDEPAIDPKQVVMEDDIKAEPEIEVADVAESTGDANLVEEPQPAAGDTVAIGDIPDTSAVEEQPIVEEQATAIEEITTKEQSMSEEQPLTAGDDNTNAESAPEEAPTVDTVLVADDEVPTEDASAPILIMVIDNAPALQESPTGELEPAIQDPPAEETLIADEAPPSEEISMVEQIPVLKETPSAEEIATVNEILTIEETRATEATPEVAAEAPIPDEAPAIQETIEGTSAVESASGAAEVLVIEKTPAEEEAAVKDEAPAATDIDVGARQPAVEEEPSALLADCAEPSCPAPSDVEEDSPIEITEDVEPVLLSEENILTESSPDDAELPQIVKTEPSNAEECHEIETAASSNLPLVEGETDAAGEDCVEKVLIETVAPQVSETADTQDTEKAPAPAAIDQVSSFSADDGDGASVAEDNENDLAVKATEDGMKFEVFNEADSTPNICPNATDSSTDPPVLPEEVFERVMKSGLNQEALQGDSESVADAHVDTPPIDDFQGNDEAVATAEVEETITDPNETDTVNRDAMQDVSDWEKNDVTDIASLADPSETEPSEQFPVESSTERVQEGEKAEIPPQSTEAVPGDDTGSTAEVTELVEVDDTKRLAPPITDLVDGFDEEETPTTTKEKDDDAATDADNIPVETETPALETAPRTDLKDVQDEIPPTSEQPAASNDVQELLEVETTPDHSEALDPVDPDGVAPQHDAEVPQSDEPKPAESSEDTDSTHLADAAAPDDAVTTVEATVDTETEVLRVDDVPTDEACASATADATSEVSLGSAQEQAVVHTPSESPAVDEALTVDVLTEVIDTEASPDIIDHDVVVAIVALAEAENSSAPDMPDEHTSQEVLKDDGSHTREHLQPDAAAKANETLNYDEDASQDSGSDSDSESEQDDWSSYEVSTHPLATDVAQPQDAPASESGPDGDAETKDLAATEESQVVVSEPEFVLDHRSILVDDASDAESSSSVSERPVGVVPEAVPAALAGHDSQIEVEEEDPGFEPPVETSPDPDLDLRASSEVSEATSKTVPESGSAPPEPTPDAAEVSDVTQDDDASEHVGEDSTINDMTAQEPSADEDISAPTEVTTEHEEDRATAEVPEPVEASTTESDAAEDHEEVADPAESGSESEAEVVDADAQPDEASEASEGNDAQETAEPEDEATSTLDAETEALPTKETADADAQLPEDTTDQPETEQEADLSALPAREEPHEPSSEPFDVMSNVEETPADADDALKEPTDIPADAGDIEPEIALAAEESGLAEADENPEPKNDLGSDAEPEATSEVPTTEEASAENDVIEGENSEDAAAQEPEPFAAKGLVEAEPAASAGEDLVVDDGEGASDAPFEGSKPDDESEAAPEETQSPATADEDEEESAPVEEVTPVEEHQQAGETVVEGGLNEVAPVEPVEIGGVVPTEIASEEVTSVAVDAPPTPELTIEIQAPVEQQQAEEELAPVPEHQVQDEPQLTSNPAAEADQVVECELPQEPEAAITPSVMTYATQDAEVLIAEAVVLTIPNMVQELDVSAPQVVAETTPIEPAEPEAIATEHAEAQATGQEGVSNEILIPHPEGEPAKVVVEAASDKAPEAQQPQESIHPVAPPEPSMEVGGAADLPRPQRTPAAASSDSSQLRERDFAIEDGPANEMPTREKTRRRISHSQRDNHHRSSRRRESESSTKERPILTGMDSTTPKSKRRDSMTERDALRRKERMREAEKIGSSSDKEKERAYPEYGSRQYRESRADERHIKRHTKDEEEDNVERQKRREARKAEKERLAAAEVARLAAEEEARKLEHRERRRAAKRAEEELLRAKETRRKLKEEERLAREEEEIKAKEARRKLKEEERIAREEEERRVRHEKRRQRHEAEKEQRRLEREELEEAERAAEEAKRAEEEAKRLRRSRRTEREAGIAPVPKLRERPVDASRDAARRAAEEDDEALPPTPPALAEESPRSAPRRRMSTRETPPNVKRGSLFGGIFGRSKPDPAPPVSKSTRPSTRARANTADSSMRPRPKTIEVPEDVVQVSRKEKEQPTSSHHIESSNESHDRAERPHRSRRLSHNQRRFKSAEEEEDYYRWKESRRYMRRPEHEMSGGRDGGVPLTPPTDDIPPPPPEPFDYGADLPPVERPESPMIEDSAAVVGEASNSSDERRERRRTRRVSTMDERPKTRDRRISVVEKERPVSRRIESDRPRTRDRGDDRPKPRRGETEGRSSRRKKEESSGLFGRLKKLI